MAEGTLVAVASSDGAAIDIEFGRAGRFFIYRIVGGGVPSAELVETRWVAQADGGDPSAAAAVFAGSCAGGAMPPGGEGCCRAGAPSPQLKARLDVLRDCACVLCAHAGPRAQKLLEQHAIALFDIQMPVDQALSKVAAWYLRGT